MDEHGQKVAQAAAARDETPQRFADESRAVPGHMGQSRHLQRSVHSYLHARSIGPASKRSSSASSTRSPDDFYQKSYAGRYCVGCEAFKTDTEIVDGRCVLHPTRTLEWVEERNWFFRSEPLCDFLRAHFDANPDFSGPKAGATRSCRYSIRAWKTFRPAGRGSPGAFPSRERPPTASRRRHTCGSMRSPTT